MFRWLHHILSRACPDTSVRRGLLSGPTSTVGGAVSARDLLGTLQEHPSSRGVGILNSLSDHLGSASDSICDRPKFRRSRNHAAIEYRLHLSGINGHEKFEDSRYAARKGSRLRLLNPVRLTEAPQISHGRQERPSLELLHHAHDYSGSIRGNVHAANILDRRDAPLVRTTASPSL